MINDWNKSFKMAFYVIKLWNQMGTHHFHEMTYAKGVGWMSVIAIKFYCSTCFEFACYSVCQMKQANMRINHIQSIVCNDFIESI